MSKKLTLAVLILLVFFTGCDIFNTRDPESPTAARSNQVFPSSPQVLINNLTASFSDKNAQNYVACLYDSCFRFIPSNSSISVYPFLNSQWDVKSEYKYFNNMILQVDQSAVIGIEFTNAKLTPYSDSTIYSAHYVLSVPFRKSSTPAVFEGDVIFSMKQDQHSRWCISTWQDINFTQSTCWSDLKGMLYN